MHEKIHRLAFSCRRLGWLAIALLAFAFNRVFADELLLAGRPVQVVVSKVSELTLGLSLRPFENDGSPVAVPDSTVDVDFPKEEKWSGRERSSPKTISLGRLKVEIKPDPLTVIVRRADGSLVQELRFDPHEGAVAFRTDAPVFGLGEGGPQFDRRGHDYPMKDGWGAFQRATHGIRVASPFLIGADGWAMFVHRPNSASDHFDLRAGRGVFKTSAPNFTGIELFIIDCREPANALAEYSRITGHAPMPPKWALGYMQSHRTIASETELLEVARNFREKQLPCDALIYLGTGYTPRGWNRGHGSVEFNPAIFPEPEKFLGRLHELNFKAVLHVNNAPRTLHGGSLLDDVSAPDGLAAYWARHRPGFALGADAWWPDDGDELEVEARLARHRLYYLGPLSDRPGERPWSLHRTGYPGVQRYGGWMWSGDPDSTWKTLETHIAVGLNHSLSLTPFWGSDTGGFIPRAEFTGELYTRWFQFSAFCPSFRSHGRTWHLHLPWGWNTGGYGPIEEKEKPDPAELHNAAVEPICRKFLELRYRLLPYNYTIAREACDNGVPMMRALWLHYPRDAEAVKVADEYLWGRGLLIAPVVEQGAKSRRVYLPGGRWHNWWTGEELQGPRWIEQPVDLATMPIYVRAGAIIPLDPVRQFTAQTVSEPTTLKIFPGADGDFTLYDDDGRTTGYRDNSDPKTIWLHCHWDDARRRLTIEPASRSQKWTAGRRTFEVEVVGRAAAKKTVVFEGKVLKVKL